MNIKSLLSDWPWVFHQISTWENRGKTNIEKRDEENSVLFTDNKTTAEQTIQTLKLAACRDQQLFDEVPLNKTWTLPICYGKAVCDQMAREFQSFKSNVQLPSESWDLESCGKTLLQGKEKQNCVFNLCEVLVAHMVNLSNTGKDQQRLRKSLDNVNFQSKRAIGSFKNKSGFLVQEMMWLLTRNLVKRF